ncbi:hypothetical protein ACEPPN_000235 [Leptodophora sp. 'Broadleaf-Isolate-01']
MKYALLYAVFLGAVAAAPLSTRDEAIDLAAHEWKEKKARADEAIDVSGYNWKEKKARADEAIDVSGYNWK